MTHDPGLVASVYSRCEIALFVKKRGATVMTGPDVRTNMIRRRERVLEVLRAVIHEFRVENLTFMAGSIAYHAFVSMLPLLVLVLLAVESLADEALAERVFAVVEAVLTPSGRSLVVDAVTGETISGLSALGLVLLIWGTLRIFRGLDQAFSDIYESEAQNTVLDQVGDGLLVLGTVLATAVVAGMVRSTLVLGDDPVGSVLGTVAIVSGLTVAFFPMYYLFPDVDLRPREVLPGAVLAAVGVTALESAFRVYVQFSSTADSYGVLGGILLVVTWLYFNGLVVLFGAAVNAVLTNHSEDVDVAPVIGDHRPVPQRTTGDRGHDRATVAAQARTLADHIEAAETHDGPLRVRVGDEEVYLPTPATVTVEDTEGSVGVELRW